MPLHEALAEPVERLSQNLAEVPLPVARSHLPQRENFADAWLVPCSQKTRCWKKGK